MLKELLCLCFCLAVALAQESPEQPEALVRAFDQDPPEQPEQLVPFIRQRRQMNPMGQMADGMGKAAEGIANAFKAGIDIPTNMAKSAMGAMPMGQGGFVGERRGRSRRDPQGQPPQMPQMPKSPQMPGGH